MGKKYLSYYEEWAKEGRMPNSGLCQIFGYDPLFTLMTPSEEDFEEMENKRLPTIFWGKGDYDDRWINGGFSPLRQNIVLFMAAMNGEL